MVKINLSMVKMIPCTQCPCMMSLVRGHYGYYYSCVCGLTHGSHQRTGEPLGIPANKETKQLRIKCHQLFDDWYKKQGIKRRLAYKRLSRIMNLPQRETHIGRFDKEQCTKLINILTNYLEN